MTLPQPWVRIADAAKRYGVHPRTILRWARDTEQQAGVSVLRRRPGGRRWLYVDAEKLWGVAERRDIPEQLGTG